MSQREKNIMEIEIEKKSVMKELVDKTHAVGKT